MPEKEKLLFVMDTNAHLKVEMVFNEDENEEEKHFNEIICYDSGDSGDTDNEQRDVSIILNAFKIKKMLIFSLLTVFILLCYVTFVLAN